jgi:hypothetical protein
MFVSRIRYDWSAVRAYYEAGHTLEECQDRFGFSRGAWDAAVGRGEIRPRERPLPRQNHHTRTAVSSLLASGMSQTEIAFRLGLSKATVCYHVRQLGIQSNDRYARRYDWAAIQQAHDAGMSRRECLHRFGCSSAAWYDAVRRGVLKPRSSEIPLEELLVAGKPRNRGHLKRRILKAGATAGATGTCGREPPSARRARGPRDPSRDLPAAPSAARSSP